MLRNIDQKQIVQVIYRDTSGCSHYRLRFNSAYFGAREDLGFIPVLMPFPATDAQWLNCTKAFVCQRFINEQDYQIVKALKEVQPKFGFKLIYELDDLCWDHKNAGVPEYNMASFNFKKNAPGIYASLAKILPLFDEIVASTEYLAKAFREDFNLHNVTVIRNVVPRYLWNCERKMPLTEDLKKPTVLLSQAPQHWRNPIPLGVSPEFPLGVTPMKGDWTDAWIEFVKKNVKEDKINFICMGALPYFFEDIADKIKFIPWKDTVNFPGEVIRTKADFELAPIADNVFNKCKSALRFTESCAIGAIMLGSDFEDSPYNEIHPACKIKTDITFDELNTRFWNLCKKDNYNSVIKWQYDHLNASGGWLESDKHINQWLSMIDGTNNSKI